MGRLFKGGISTCVLLLLLSSAQAATWTVSPGKNGLTIKQALEKAASGDTILVKSGHYQEGALIVKKRITLLGEGFPVIDGENKFENLLIDHDSVTVEGLRFINSAASSYEDLAAVKVQNAKQVVIRNNKFENNFFGIHSMNSGYVTIENNQLLSGENPQKPAANGIHCWKSKYLRIVNNTISGHRDGIYFEFVTHSLIENNRSIGNKRYGLHFMFSHDDTYKHNIIRKNGAGVAVMYSKRVKMYNNIFADNWGNAAYGLLLKEMSDSHIENNLFTLNTISIFAEGANRVTMVNNQFYKNGWAMQIQASCSEVTVTKNNFIANTFDVATNGFLVMNHFDENFWDKYQGYDLNRDGYGDIPHRPVTFYSVIIQRNPGALMLFRSFFISLMDKAETLFPNLTPEHLKDNKPKMKKLPFKEPAND